MRHPRFPSSRKARLLLAALGMAAIGSCSGDSTSPPEPTPPAPPSNVQAVGTSPTEVTVTWVDNADDETQFRVDRALADPPSPSFNPVGTVGANVTTFEDSGLTPVTAYVYRVQACNAAGCSETVQSTAATTFKEPLAIVRASLPPAEEGRDYAETLTAVGSEGEEVWSLGSGTLPQGITLGPDGLLSGQPVGTGVYTFVVRVAEGGEEDAAEFTLTVVEPTVRIQSLFLRGAYPGVAYADTLVADGGDGEPTFGVAVGELPEGLALDPATGVISGVPAAPGTRIFTVEARDEGGDLDFRVLSIGVSTKGPEAFNLWPVVAGGGRPDERIVAALDSALAKWERVLIGNLTALALEPGSVGPTFCAGNGRRIDGEVIDDVAVLVNIDQIDGPGQVLGRAGPCSVRTPGLLPWVGILTLDVADLDGRSEAALAGLFFHEIGHILGFGTLWGAEPDDFGFDVLTGFARPRGSDPDPRYDGPEAVAAYQAIGGTEATIAVANTGGEGTANGHWREFTFDTEIMTGFTDGEDDPLSKMTIGAFADMGYQVDLDADDGYRVPSGAARRASPAEEARKGWDEILREPILLVSPEGRPVGVLGVR